MDRTRFVTAIPDLLLGMIIQTLTNINIFVPDVQNPAKFTVPGNATLMQKLDAAELLIIMTGIINSGLAKLLVLLAAKALLFIIQEIVWEAVSIIVQKQILQNFFVMNAMEAINYLI